MSPDNIVFEINESIAIAHLAKVCRFIETFSGLGCRFILDNFGSGLSSFNYLKNLNVQYLKIDGRFIKNLPNDHVDRIMVGAIHNIVQAMGLKTIANLVENKQTREMLRTIGVNYVQGFAILSGVHPITELESVLSHHTSHDLSHMSQAG